MTRPGTQILSRESAPPRSAPTDTGVWFVAGITEKGAAGPTLVRSLTDFATKFGSRVSYGTLYDSIEAFFREGGGRVYVSRVFGPAPVVATVTLNDDTEGTLLVSATSPGDWANALNVEVIEGDNASEYVIIVTHDDLGELDRTPSLSTKDEAISWSEGSSYVDITSLAGDGIPIVATAAPLTGGTDDHDNATDATWATALDYFTADLGPGQVSFPGRTTTVAHTELLTHARDFNRLAVLDAPDSSSVATLKTSASGLRTLDIARYGGLFAPYAIIPGLVAGTTRTIPYSAVAAGIMARNDGAGLSPNEPAAGLNGISRYALDLTQTYTNTEREELNEGGVNIARVLYGQVRTYGYRSLVNPLTAANAWLMLSNARVYMAIAAQADVIAERYVFAQLDGRRRKVAQFGGELTGMLIPFYESGALYGATPDEAFAVDVGAQINTDESMAAGELRAVISLRMSPFGELVTIEIVKVANTEAVA